MERRGNGRGGRAGRKKMTKNVNFSPRPATKAAAQSPRKINLSVSVSRSLRPRLPLPPSCSLAWIFSGCSSTSGIESNSLLTWALRSLPLDSHLHYEREDLLAAEYNANLSVSIHRDREPSSSRVPLRHSYTYPPSAARRGTEKTKRGGRNRGEENGTGLSEYFTPGRVSSARVLLVRRKSQNRWLR